VRLARQLRLQESDGSYIAQENEIGGLPPVCTSLQYARDFTYKIAIFDDQLHNETWFNSNEILKLRYPWLV